MSVEMYTDPRQKDLEPGADAIKAKHVLDTLSQMQEDGASTRAQFEFLRQQLPREQSLEEERLSIEIRLEQQETAKADLHYVKDKPLVKDPDDEHSVLDCPALKKNERVKEPEKKSDEKLVSKKAGLENSIKEEASRAYPLKTRPAAEHVYESGKKVSSVSERPKPVTDSQDDEGPDHLRRDAWAEALRELTAQPWKFDRELHGRTGAQGLEGDVLHFTVVSPEIYSARLTVIPMPEGQQEVTLELQGKKMQRRTETLSKDEAEKLHLDPMAFVKKTLELE